VDGPLAWVSMATTTPLPEHVTMMHGDPTSTTTVFTHEITQAKDLNDQEHHRLQPTVLSTEYDAQLGDKHHEKDDQPISCTTVLRKVFSYCKILYAFLFKQRKYLFV
jgi:hypothetical protein